MRKTDVIVIGAGHAGLAMSYCLAARGIEHVVLERGRIAERWRSERWDSLRLLTPNWMSRLPGWSYAGSDPDGYMSMADVTAYLDGYARSFSAPVATGAEVRALLRVPGGYRLETGRESWQSRVVVVATGHCDRPLVPTMAWRMPRTIHQVTPAEYRGPQDLPAGGVLVVGASASGVQLAEEIHRSGRAVSLAVGAHTRLPRRYRGRDILAWMERVGVLDETTREVRDIARSRAQPSLQLIGNSDGRSLDLPALRRQGIRLLGRLRGIDDGVLVLADDLAATTAAAQATLERLLARIDPVADAEGAPAQEWPRCFAAGVAPVRLDPIAAGIRSVVWATGYRRDYSWLLVPVLDAAGEIRHDGGVTASSGLYALGLRFMRRRRSSFLDGAGTDALELATHIEELLRSTSRDAA